MEIRVRSSCAKIKASREGGVPRRPREIQPQEFVSSRAQIVPRDGSVGDSGMSRREEENPRRARDDNTWIRYVDVIVLLRVTRFGLEISSVPLRHRRSQRVTRLGGRQSKSLGSSILRSARHIRSRGPEVVEQHRRTRTSETRTSYRTNGRKFERANGTQNLGDERVLAHAIPCTCGLRKLSETVI